MAGSGFVVAHGLHFLEVCAYFGSVPAALTDLGNAAAYRSGAIASASFIEHIRQGLDNLVLYVVGQRVVDFASILPNPSFDGQWPMYRFFGMSLGLWWVIVTAGLVVWSGLRPGPRAETLRMQWYIVYGAGLVTSSLWLMVMVNHSAFHERFIYRHLFFLWFVCILFGATSFSRIVWTKRKSNATPTAGAST
jgi:hypothetical protein